MKAFSQVQVFGDLVEGDNIVWNGSGGIRDGFQVTVATAR
jgi:hypothetical protein